MAKGRNAAKTFTATRGARFADSRKRTEEQKAAERAAGTRRTSMMVDVDDVQDDDMVVMTRGGFERAGDVERADWATSDGKTFVQRFVTDGE